jgi:hypothetical protein
MSNQVQPIDLWPLLYGLERRTLDEGHMPATIDLHALLNHVPFVRVKGVAAFWKSRGDSRYDQRMDDVVISLHGLGLSLLFLVIGHSNRSGVYVGLQGPLPSDRLEVMLRTILSSSFPGVKLLDHSEPQLAQFLQQQQFFRFQGLMSGIPTRKSAERLAESPGSQRRGHQGEAVSKAPSQGPLAQLERLIRGLKGTNWGYLVRATPIELQVVLAEASRRFSEVGEVSKDAKRQFQQVTQIMVQRTQYEQEGTTLSASSEMVNREAEYVIELLERQLDRLNEARAVGMWNTVVSVFAAEELNVQRAGALLRAVFAGVDSRPDPIRVTLCGPAGIAPAGYATPLTSIELSTLTQLPGEEFPGYQVTDFAVFDLDFTPRPTPPTVELGTIDDQGCDTGLLYEVARDDFAKHGLITGVTGSGKTTTIFGILDALWCKGKGGVPFLVIEPAKAEYRSLRGRFTNGPLPDLIVYTLGDETVTPFRLNPFEFEIFDADHFVHVQTHIDYLKSVFNAAFILYAPMPYVLEICLHEIYQDCGWDLTSSRNLRVPEHLWGKASDFPVFPTLADLARKIDVVTERLGYEERIKMDVQAGLKARIGSLMIGGKGHMLNTRSGIPTAALLRRPTILELERVGNDDEKAFLMGLILTRLYEYRRVQASRASGALPFQHLVVVEEAHRLLQNISTQVDTEGSNVKGHAVETFTNMLAEIRAYGQGMLIVDQIPSKLAPDAIKNTNLKLVHRLIAEDDRRALGGAMNMDEDQMRYLIALPPGRAAVYSEGADHPYLVRVRDYTSVRMTGRPNDRDLSAALSQERRRPCFEPAKDYQRLMPAGLPLHIAAFVEDAARSVIRHEEFFERWGGWLLTSMHLPSLAYRQFGEVRTLVARQIAGKSIPLELVTLAVGILAAQDDLLARGRTYGWSYETVEALRVTLVATLEPLMAGDEVQTEQRFKQFASAYTSATSRSHGPFAGCTHCVCRCLYRPEGEHIMRGGAFRTDWEQATRIGVQANRLAELAAVARYSAEQVVTKLNPELVVGLALCAAVQVMASMQYTRNTQAFISAELVRQLQTPHQKVRP